MTLQDLIDRYEGQLHAAIADAEHHNAGIEAFLELARARARLEAARLCAEIVRSGG
jgi:hypothetical protein